MIWGSGVTGVFTSLSGVDVLEVVRHRVRPVQSNRLDAVDSWVVQEASGGIDGHELDDRRHRQVLRVASVYSCPSNLQYDEGNG